MGKTLRCIKVCVTGIRGRRRYEIDDPADESNIPESARKYFVPADGPETGEGGNVYQDVFLGPEELNKFTVKDLGKLALERFGVELDTKGMKKAEVIATIIAMDEGSGAPADGPETGEGGNEGEPEE